MNITFGTSVVLYDGEDPVDVFVEADITPSDPGGLHCPPSGPIPEIVAVTVDGFGLDETSEFEPNENVTDLIDEDHIQILEERAILEYEEQGSGREDEEPPDDDMFLDRDYHDYQPDPPFDPSMGPE